MIPKTINELLALDDAEFAPVREAIRADWAGGGDVLSYGIVHFSPSACYPLPPEQLTRYWARIPPLSREWKALEETRRAAKEAVLDARVAAISGKSMPKTGQRWEPCSRCGAEPVDMSTGLCRRCEE